MRAHFPSRCLPGVLSVVCLLLISCTPQPGPTTPAVVSTARPTIVLPTSTPEPYTPSPVRWLAPPVLALITHSGGMVSRRDHFPTLVLYADGRMLRLSEDGEQMLEGWLTRQQICDLLSQIDATGFFDYVPAPAKYVVYDVPTTQVTVNAWHGRTVFSQALLFMPRPENITPSPEITDVALIRTYYLLLDSVPPDLQPYRPDRLVLEIQKVEKDRYTYTEPIPWPLTALPLSDLAARKTQPRDTLILQGDDLATLLSIFPTGSGGGFYQEGTRYYSFYSRPLLPLEAPLPSYETMLTINYVQGQPAIPTTSTPAVPWTGLSDVRPIPDPSLNLPTVEFSCGRQ